MKVISIHNFISSSGSDFLTSYGSGSGSTSQKVRVPVPQHWFLYYKINQTYL
jgi:hypothetical protein